MTVKLQLKIKSKHGYWRPFPRRRPPGAACPSDPHLVTALPNRSLCLWVRLFKLNRPRNTKRSNNERRRTKTTIRRPTTKPRPPTNRQRLRSRPSTAPTRSLTRIRIRQKEAAAAAATRPRRNRRRRRLDRGPPLPPPPPPAARVDRRLPRHSVTEHGEPCYSVMPRRQFSAKLTKHVSTLSLSLSSRSRGCSFKLLLLLTLTNFR